MSIYRNGQEEFKGQVLTAEIRETRVMSDVWDFVCFAVVSNPDGTTSVYSGMPDTFQAKVDAPQEKIDAYFAKIAEEKMIASEKAEKEAEEFERKKVRVGKKVQVVKGYKVAKGTSGVVFWIGNTMYGDKVGIALDDTRNAKGMFANVVWTYLRNVAVMF